jgi:hypothetical protein
MCRSIKQLRNFDDPPTDAEIDAAAVQFVRKVSGYNRPSRVNETAFNDGVREIADATRRMLDSLRPARATSEKATASAGSR